MQRFSAWARWIATVILIPIFTAVVARFIWEQPGETAHVVLKFLLDLSEQTWLRALRYRTTWLTTWAMQQSQ
jgi:hypothetical protein